MERLLANYPCPFDVNTPLAQGIVNYIFLTKAEGEAFMALHPTLSIEGVELTFSQSVQRFYGPQEGIDLVYTYPATEQLNDLQAVRATGCLGYPEPKFDPVCWGRRKASGRI